MGGTVAVIQARMGSTRLPGKVLRTVQGKPLLQILIERVQKARSIDEIIVVTPDGLKDRPIVEVARMLGVRSFAGSEEDVLDRFARAIEPLGCSQVVRLTGDCPLIDPEIIDQVVGHLMPPLAYVSNCVQRTYPRGLDVEACTSHALLVADEYAIASFEREHVTPYIYQRPENFGIGHVMHVKNLSSHRWTVDTPEDFVLVEKILEHFLPENPDFSWKDVVEFIEKNPSLKSINAHIEQKKL